MVGHEIGMMVAYAFASGYPKAVEKLVLGGTTSGNDRI